jgi:hypothetical protein
MHKGVLLKFRLVRFWLGLHMMVMIMQNALANPARQWMIDKDDRGHKG